MTTIEQLPATVNLHFVQGDTFRRRLRFYQTIATVDTDEDISGWTITAQIRPFAYSESYESFSVAFVTDGTDGEVDISLTAAQAARLPEIGVWDLQRTDTGEVLTLLAGSVAVDREVTR